MLILIMFIVNHTGPGQVYTYKIIEFKYKNTQLMKRDNHLKISTAKKLPAQSQIPRIPQRFMLL